MRVHSVIVKSTRCKFNFVPHRKVDHWWNYSESGQWIWQTPTTTSMVQLLHNSFELRVQIAGSILCEKNSMGVHFKVERKLNRKWRSMQASPLFSTRHQPHWNIEIFLVWELSQTYCLSCYLYLYIRNWSTGISVCFCTSLRILFRSSIHILLKSGAKLSVLPWVLWRKFPCHRTSVHPWVTVERPSAVPNGPLVLNLLTTCRDGTEVKASGLFRWKNPQEGWEYKTAPPTPSTCWLYSFLSFELLSLLIIELHVCVCVCVTKKRNWNITYWTSTHQLLRGLWNILWI